MVGVLWLVWPTEPPVGVEPSTALVVTASGRQLLFRDEHGDGRIAEVFGDLARARRIGVIVPGVDNTLANFTTGFGGVPYRAPSWQARQLWLATGDPLVAVVAWLGYDPPEGVGRDAIRSERAAAGASALIRFLSDLSSRHPGASFVLIGHSYGSVVVGRAAPDLGRPVTDLVAIGSPGLDVDRIEDLHTRARLWAGTAATDWTRLLPGVRVLGLGHGIPPATPSFGALPLPVDGVTGHDGYFRPGSSSLRAMADVMRLVPPPYGRVGSEE
jgi:pimeloyl-ACP methyl ester carboxylesterase